MVLPPIERVPVILMRFTSKASPDLITLVKERLCLGGLIVLVDERLRNNKEHVCILGVTTSQQEVEAEAEQVHFMKKTMDTNAVEYFTVSTRDRFKGKPSFELHERDEHGMFTPNDWAILVRRLLQNLTVLPPGQSSTNLSRMLNLHQVAKKKMFQSKRDLFHQTHEQEITLELWLRQGNYVDVITPIHYPKCRKAILTETMKLRNLIPPIDAIGNYYGKKVAFYFAWMSFLTKWLLFPGLLGLAVYIIRIVRGDTIDTDELTPFYGLITFCWAVLFHKFWTRHENRLSYWWGTLSLSPYEKQKFFAQRPNYHGTLQKSPVTGNMEVFYSDKKRRLQYVVSGTLTALLLLLAFSVMILSLNLQGYIRPKNDPERWNDEHPHPFHYPFLSILAEEGNLFDAASQWRCYVPVLLHVCCILAMNTMYRRIAEWLTNWENHETEQEFQNALILKRFLFEAFDCYVALFYLAFYERDVHRLRGELVSVFYIDTFRRVLIECILPMVYKSCFSHTTRQKAAQRKKHKDYPQEQDYAPLAVEADLDEYEQFDDYMEIVIQLGYVTLFASAYPLASLIAIVANLVEIRADCFKLSRICQRPQSIRADGLGMWKSLISCIIWTSALTNCLLFGFTSRQLMQYMPEYYYVDELDHLRLVPGKGWIVVFLIFGMERLLICIGLFINMIVPDIPEDVAIELERRQHLRFEDRKAARVNSALKRARQERQSIVASQQNGVPFFGRYKKE